LSLEVLSRLTLTADTDSTAVATAAAASQVDLDTIDLSNLNRQFLFRKPDISKPKASVAAATARQFNPRCSIDARHANIKDETFDSLWFARFGLVFGALDNMGAYRWEMLMAEQSSGS
jgi:molybdopterin/thiamine biosynthesis adenylyltransferase